MQAEASHEAKAPKLQPRESAERSGCCCFQLCWPKQRGAGPLSICLEEANDRLAAFKIPCGLPLSLIQAPSRSLSLPTALGMTLGSL